jgi:hypothetical protein
VIIQVLDNQVLIWLGSLYAPLLPLFGLAFNVLTFYTKKFLSLYLYTPPKERYSASRTNVLVYSLMLGAILQLECCPDNETSIIGRNVLSMNIEEFAGMLVTLAYTDLLRPPACHEAAWDLRADPGGCAALLAACSVPTVYNLQFKRTTCGPHQGTSMTSALGLAVSQGPQYVQIICPVIEV